MVSIYNVDSKGNKINEPKETREQKMCKSIWDKL